MTALISGVRLTDQELRPLRNYLFERYHPSIYHQVDKLAASSAWLHTYRNRLPLDWRPTSASSAEQQQKLRQWRLGELYDNLPSFGYMLGSLISKDIDLFGSLWPCPYSEQKQRQVILFPNNLNDTIPVNIGKRALSVLVDTHYDTNFEPFVLLGVVTAELAEPATATTAAIHSKRYPQGLSGVRVPNIDCQKEVADFLLTYYSELDVDTFMTSYGNYVFDASSCWYQQHHIVSGGAVPASQDYGYKLHTIILTTTITTTNAERNNIVLFS